MVVVVRTRVLFMGVYRLILIIALAMANFGKLQHHCPSVSIVHLIKQALCPSVYGIVSPLDKLCFPGVSNIVLCIHLDKLSVQVLVLCIHLDKLCFPIIIVLCVHLDKLCHQMSLI